MEKIKVLFAGTSDFAIPTLEKLLKLDYIDLVGLLTQPDRPVGRKQVLTPPATKQFLVSSGSNIRVFQPEKLRKKSKSILEEVNPDLVIVASYGQFIPKSMLTIPKFKCINIHGSVLPKLRGAVPIPMSILEGMPKTGVTIQIMEKEMDAGDLIGYSEIAIDEKETTGTLTKKLANLGADLLESVLLPYVRGEITPTKQDESGATYCYQSDIKKENAQLDFNLSAIQLDQKIRAFNPWPVAWVTLSEKHGVSSKYFGKRLKIFSAEVVNKKSEKQPGEFFKYEKSIAVATKNEILILGDIQLEGKQLAKSSNYLYVFG